MFTFYRWLSLSGNSFLVHSVSIEIGSAYAQHAIKSFPRMLSIRMLYFLKNTQKYKIKMQILTINNQNFQKSSRNPSNRTKVRFWRKFFLGLIIKKIWFCVCSFCSITAEMFEHRNSGEYPVNRNITNGSLPTPQISLGIVALFEKINIGEPIRTVVSNIGEDVQYRCFN
jgi:hypothetical protein